MGSCFAAHLSRPPRAGDAAEVLSGRAADCADVVYLDPMFPRERKRKAAAGSEYLELPQHTLSYLEL